MGVEIKLVELTMEREVEGSVCKADLPSQTCDNCGNTVIDCSSLELFELKVVMDLLKRDSINGKTFKYMRKTLGINIKDIPNVFGISAEQATQWEDESYTIQTNLLTVVHEMASERIKQIDQTITLVWS